MFEYFFAFYPLFNGYKFGPIGLGFVVYAISALYTLRNQGFRLKISKISMPYAILFAYVLIKEGFIVVLGKSDSSASLHQMIQMAAFMILFLILCSRQLDLDKFYKGLKIAGILYTLGLVYHLVLIYVFGRGATMISIFPGFNVGELEAYDRPRSFFPEPAALAQAMLPLLFFSLKKKEYKYALMATFTIFMSTSTMGVALGAVLWFFEFIIVSESKPKRTIVVVVFAGMAAILLRTEFARQSLLTIQNRLSGGGSTTFRINLGFELISKLEPIHYIFGTLYNLAYDYVVQNIGRYGSESLVAMIASFGEIAFFVNSFCALIFRYGIIGFVLYSRTYKGKLFEKKYIGRSLAWMTVIELIGDTMLFNAYYFFIMLILVYLQKEGEDTLEGLTYRIRPWKSNA